MLLLLKKGTFVAAVLPERKMTVHPSSIIMLTLTTTWYLLTIKPFYRDIQATCFQIVAPTIGFQSLIEIICLTLLCSSQLLLPGDNLQGKKRSKRRLNSFGTVSESKRVHACREGGLSLLRALQSASDCSPPPSQSAPVSLNITCLPLFLFLSSSPHFSRLSR